MVGNRNSRRSWARSTRLYPFIVLASATGCRRGELLALQWPGLAESTGELSVSRSLEQTKAGLRVKSTKSGEPRKFVVPDPAISVLAEHRAQQEGDKRMFGPDDQDHGLIFCQPNGAYYSPDRVGARVKELILAVGLEGVSLHSLRHPFASELLSKKCLSRWFPNASGTPTGTSRYRSIAVRFLQTVGRRRFGGGRHRSTKKVCGGSDYCELLHGRHLEEIFC
ncbi:MAG TPA: tyrosine-type recombinase/integrase [Bryobacteraceae bacterium]|nr:tyrosine-type recombinase/integrase [Bryobacteraceae bacterium]